MFEDVTPGPADEASLENGALLENDSADGSSRPSSAPELDDWKRELRADFERWLESLDEIPETEDDGADEPELPDLYSFYEQLAIATAESRKVNRRTAEAFSQWSETLAGFDGDLRLMREQLARTPVPGDDRLPRSWCLALIEIIDRLHRLAAAFATPPHRTWYGGDTRWRAAWNTQQHAFEILVSHADALVASAGVTRIQALHQPFDPARMSAVVAEPDARWPHHTVTEEITPGYLLLGELLRVAQVKVSTRES